MSKNFIKLNEEIIELTNTKSIFVEEFLKFSIEQSEELNVMGNFYKILNLVFKFDLRDNPNGGTYSLLEAAYLKLIQDKGIPLTEGNHISARRLSRMFSIFCVMSFLDSVDFYADLRDQFIEAVYQAKISWSTDYKHNKKSTIQNIKNLTNQQVKNIMINVVNYDKDSFKKQMKELGVGRVNVEKMFDGSTEMIPLFKNLFNEKKWLEGFN